MGFSGFRHFLVLLFVKAALSSPPISFSSPNEEIQTRREEGDGSFPFGRTSESAVSSHQVHLTLHPSPDRLVATWTSFGRNPTAVLRFGFEKDGLDGVVNGEVDSYKAEKCSKEKWRTIHTAIFPVSGSKSTFYSVSSDGVTWSDTFEALPVEHQKVPMTVSLFGDMGILCETSSVPALVNATRKREHTAVVHFGDSAYNMEDDCAGVGDAFLEATQGYAASTPVLWGNGNHERGSKDTYVEYVRRLAGGQGALTKASGSGNRRWYSFRLGLMKVVMIDTDVWIYLGSMRYLEEQWRWMDEELGRTNRTETPWVVVIGHRAMYCTKTKDGECNGEAKRIRDGMFFGRWAVEPLLLKHGVDLYFSGHTHHYEVTWPVRGLKALQFDYQKPMGPVHVQSGIAGVDPPFDPFDVPQEKWERIRDTSFSVSFSQMTIHNRTHVTIRQLDAANSTAFDEFTVFQPDHGPFKETETESRSEFSEKNGNAKRVPQTLPRQQIPHAPAIHTYLRGESSTLNPIGEEVGVLPNGGEEEETERHRKERKEGEEKVLIS
uniref:Purple acid phosphatase n=1 Tax=Chromera velia CCMP2878 TaxID=1169474 RepID=A0A0G4HXW2_9ALVE|mmetsp:Transcript_43251/g.85304  ORF Transcript_43251/g.85304 Transcript_43251/m.85304 type:complete len:548 (+) Transcript_43251:146-1789(+)|eukprot:Cvel_9364.t1-p1 / transcript=Cvel_9364.t1 / gene=Cvel_9364 / organism=Chromera_velia_CCMP2878 / gene_product=Iron/zinc purple acid phosphatase-like protein, putative / transcript_product=Iron/zinc purple acid phosphatase-like protein, putative / location=Cvel_scaffold537:70609-74059(+) / protein_length=547 / sequence_SO=supercontig / SO=protein_coding / is_pseudo=false